MPWWLRCKQRSSACVSDSDLRVAFLRRRKNDPHPPRNPRPRFSTKTTTEARLAFDFGHFDELKNHKWSKNSF